MRNFWLLLTVALTVGCGGTVVAKQVETQPGSPASEKYRDDDETEHQVTLTKPFYMGRTEVTQGQWEKVMGTESWKGKEYVREGDDYPAVYVSWGDAVEFCKKLSSMDGKVYRLPNWQWI